MTIFKGELAILFKNGETRRVTLSSDYDFGANLIDEETFKTIGDFLKIRTERDQFVVIRKDAVAGLFQTIETEEESEKIATKTEEESHELPF